MRRTILNESIPSVTYARSTVSRFNARLAALTICLIALISVNLFAFAEQPVNTAATTSSTQPTTTASRPFEGIRLRITVHSDAEVGETLFRKMEELANANGAKLENAEVQNVNKEIMDRAIYYPKSGSRAMAIKIRDLVVRSAAKELGVQLEGDKPLNVNQVDQILYYHIDIYLDE